MTDFDDDLFQDSAARMSALGTALSADALQGVAREVVSQLAQKRQMPQLLTDPDHPDAARIEQLCDALVSGDPAAARDMMRQFQREGVTLDVLYARYLAAAAARLGELWDEDVLTFSNVTTGVGRIYDIIRVLRDALPTPAITRSEPVLFAAVPGEEHNVGLQMAAELFRQRGWDVHTMLDATHDEILGQIDRMRFLIIGLSSSGRASAEALARLIHAVRVAHPGIYILVSGQIVTQEADLIALMAPDGAVATVEDALETIETLVAQESL